MDPDRQQIDIIKTHFARKSSAQLQEIARANRPERWSPEAVVAAGEVLQERLAGRAQEPAVAEEDPPLPPPAPSDPLSVGFLALGVLSGLGGFGIFPVYRVNYEGKPDPDLPAPFGLRVAWLALDTRDTEAAATALGLREVQPATWAEGIAAAYRSSVYVTPPWPTGPWW
ncbi:MAG: hypothetical protein JO112_01530 [Planctomycetes bacterium]|nr:hypothetical protein [Planctomycetota bacterium]